MPRYSFPDKGLSIEAPNLAAALEKLNSGDKKESGVPSKKTKKKSSPSPE